MEHRNVNNNNNGVLVSYFYRFLNFSPKTNSITFVLTTTILQQLTIQAITITKQVLHSEKKNQRFFKPKNCFVIFAFVHGNIPRDQGKVLHKKKCCLPKAFHFAIMRLRASVGIVFLRRQDLSKSEIFEDPVKYYICFGRVVSSLLTLHIFLDNATNVN